MIRFDIWPMANSTQLLLVELNQPLIKADSAQVSTHANFAWLLTYTNFTQPLACSNFIWPLTCVGSI